jgi:micrococcal nuclease
MIVGVVLVTLAVLDHAGLLLVERDGGIGGRPAPVDIIRVIDGDTVEAALLTHGETKTVRLRLWGIDAPEINWDEPDASDPAAFMARDRLAEILRYGPVTMIVEPHREFDRYGRVLAHLRLDDGRLAAEVLVAEGLVHADPRWTHQYATRLAQLEIRARRAGIGLWAGDRSSSETYVDP